jgi:hypothetical protein
MDKKVEEALDSALDWQKCRDDGRCPRCNQDIGDFRTLINLRAFQDTGMCQGCQDAVLGDVPQPPKDGNVWIN